MTLEPEFSQFGASHTKSITPKHIIKQKNKLTLVQMITFEVGKTEIKNKYPQSKINQFKFWDKDPSLDGEERSSLLVVRILYSLVEWDASHHYLLFYCLWNLYSRVTIAVFFEYLQHNVLLRCRGPSVIIVIFRNEVHLCKSLTAVLHYHLSAFGWQLSAETNVPSRIITEDRKWREEKGRNIFTNQGQFTVLETQRSNKIITADWMSVEAIVWVTYIQKRRCW